MAIESALIERDDWHELSDEQKEQVVLALTEAERTIMAIEAMEREVNNGGFSQFFINSSKHFAPHIVQALQNIGCTKFADLAATAISRLRLEPGFNGEDCDRAYMALMDEINPELDELDGQFQETCGEEPLLDNLFSYIEKHASEIRIPRAT